MPSLNEAIATCIRIGDKPSKSELGFLSDCSGVSNIHYSISWTPVKVWQAKHGYKAI